MKADLIHTPEGVRDIYGDEYSKKLQVEGILHEQLERYGYQDIQTPTFEFLEVFGKEIGTTPVKDLFKFCDSDGNLLCLRPDFTPSMARCAAKYFSETRLPLRLSYQGNTFSNTNLLQGKLKENTQMGGELMGDPSVEADGEIISMVVESLLAAGLQDFQVSIGEVDYFRGLCEEWKLSVPQEARIRELVSNKNYLAAKEYLQSEQVAASAIETFSKIEELVGTVEVLQDARQLTRNSTALEAVERLSELYQVLTYYGVEKYVSFDLGMLNSYQYYTGIIFKAYTHGIGDVVVKGGRYDRLLSFFGKNSPAIGFVIVIDDLMQALRRQKIRIPLPENKVWIIYTLESYGEALQKAKKLREEKQRVQLLPKESAWTKADYEKLAEENGVHQVLYFE